jgi:hypothetical protein
MSFMHPFDEMFVSIPELLVAKEKNNVPQTSVITGVSYLGYGNERKMNGVPDLDPPSHVSEAFSEGLIAGLTIPASHHNQPVNPYSINSGTDPYEDHKSKEWSTGLHLGRSQFGKAANEIKTAPVETPTVSKEQLANSDGQKEVTKTSDNPKNQK